MRNLEILTFPDPRLRTKASIVEVFDDELRIMAENMLHTMSVSYTHLRAHETS